VEEVLVGRAPFYRLEYGQYIVGMNTTPDQTFQLHDDGHGKARVLAAATKGSPSVGDIVELSRPLKVPPMSTVVLHIA
jgi:hypothetical protein